ncbi:hypothetical protein [Cerasicoccus fimbriatus]|uniref:hypothetical protein n=1 Tax=Cerasicoccus fimbriatus TaxID=3014554 RepID=UPI0022B559C7|nr:hypothetical protein [Cerasicoccus sp. TK19100]
MKKWGLILCVLFNAAFAFGEEPEEIVTEFFAKLSAGQSSEAVDYIFAKNDWVKTKEDAIAKYKGQLATMVSMVGSYHGFELVKTEEIGDSLMGCSVIARYDRQPVRFIFIFYRPNDTWQVQNVNFDDSIDADLREALKRP